MKIIHAKCGTPIFVDDIDFDLVRNEKWSLTGKGYVCSSKGVFMHRLIAGLRAGDGMQVDHRNGRKTDNRRRNLRAATHASNQWNRPVQRNSSTGLKGVSRDRNGRWVARIQANGRRVQLGMHDTKELAHEIYQLAAQMLHGDFARY